MEQPRIVSAGVFNAVSHSMPDSETINFVMNAGNTGVRVTQVLRYVNGKNYFTKQWNIATGRDRLYRRALHSRRRRYFANSDSACGYHNADLDMVYPENTNAAGLMGFQAVAIHARTAILPATYKPILWHGSLLSVKLRQH